jgi:hypothetical protein
MLAAVSSSLGCMRIPFFRAQRTLTAIVELVYTSPLESSNPPILPGSERTPGELFHIMSTSVQDYQLAALAAGFTIGFGILTIWEAIKQTRRNRNPLRSAYIYMVWGEVLVNLIISIIAWLFLNDKLGPS